MVATANGGTDRLENLVLANLACNVKVGEISLVDKIKLRANPNLQILGALITLHDKRTLLSRDIQQEIFKVFGDRVFETVISKSVRLEESPAYKESIFSFAPQSSGAFEYYKLSEEVLSRV